MKILHINTFDIAGGAARATYRLHKALQEAGIDSQILVQFKASLDKSVIEPQSNFQKLYFRLRQSFEILWLLLYRKRIKSIFSPCWIPFSLLLKRMNALNPDIVHLHWVAGGMLRFEDIAKIRQPIVWTMHDSWLFTGGCHIPRDCVKYQNQCGSCPHLASKSEKDLSRTLHLRKHKVLTKKPDIRVIGVSNWLTERAKKSSLLVNHQVYNLPNPINTKIFSPFDKATARGLHNLPLEKKLILFGAMNANSDPRKGFKKLSQAFMYLSKDYELVIFGASEPRQPQEFKQKTHYLGHLHDDVSLRVLYSAADVMVVPSLQEPFGQTASESLACGTPVVAFAATGLLDIVDHKINGYLAKPYEPDDLAAGIEWVLSAENYAELCQNAREKVLREFDSKIVAKKYIELYQEVLGES